MDILRRKNQELFLYKTFGRHFKGITMKIQFDEKEKSIEIKDGLKTQYLLIKMMLFITFINSILFPVFILDKKQLEWLGFTWIGINDYADLSSNE